MVLKTEKWMVANEWQYYIDTHFAIFPTLLNYGQVFPKFMWFKKWWVTYPVDEDGKVIDMYRTIHLEDPRDG